MSVISNFLGFGGDPTAEKRKVPKSLARLSLSQLSNRIRDLNVAAGITPGEQRSSSKIESNREINTGGNIKIDPGKDPGLGRLKTERRKSDVDLTPEEARKQSERNIRKRLGKLGEARRGLIKRVTGARTQRATSISTLLGRGI